MKQEKKEFEKYVKPNWWKRNWVEICTIIGGLISINLIFCADAFTEINTVNPESAAQLGEFVGGYIGTIFALVSVVFLYSTLKSQRETSQIEAFQNKYFELIKMHRDNVNEIGIGDEKGKKIFVLLLREYRSILNVVKEVAGITSQTFTQEEMFVISYYALFFGVGPNSSRMLKGALKYYDKDFVNQLERKLRSKYEKLKVKDEHKFAFNPFGGHQSRLGHYYRHLFQTVSYVDNQSINIDKYEYAKNLRAQLTTHEQALFFINSLTPMGKDWWTNGLIVNYRLVRNIPLDFFDKNEEIDIEKYFPDKYFEWQEITHPNSDSRKPAANK
jgi:hypothetical protein